MKLAAQFSERAASFLAATACVQHPDASAPYDETHAIESDKVRPAHGWVATRYEDGHLWYIQVIKDQHGFGIDGRSGPTPPEGIDPSTIPVVSAGARFPYEKRLLQTKRLVNGFYPGVGFNIRGISFTVGEALSDRDRLAQLWTVHLAETIIAKKHHLELRDAFLQPLQQYVHPLESLNAPGDLINWDGVKRMLQHFKPIIAFHQRAMVVDAPVAGLYRLLDTALAELGFGTLPATQFLFGFINHLQAFGGIDKPIPQVHVALLYLRKAASPQIVKAIGDRLLMEAEDTIDAALKQDDLSTFLRLVFQAGHAAWLAMLLFNDLKSAFPNLDPMLGKSANVAEEWTVRATHSVETTFLNLEGTRFAPHRFKVNRALELAGTKLRDQKIDELIEQYVYYPRSFADAFRQPPPLNTSDEEALGRAYLLEYYRLVGYCDARDATEQPR
jgi:hypothetical protein